MQNKLIMKKTLIAAILPLCIFSCPSAHAGEPRKVVVPAGPSAAQTEKPSAPSRAVTILSESQIQVKPEVALISVYFTGYGWTVEKAKIKTDQLVRKFLDKLSKEKIDPSDVLVGEIKLKPSYQFNRDLKANVQSDFLVTRQVILKLEDFSVIGKILDASVSAGSFFVESARLTVKDKLDLEQKAFRNTLEEGRKKAEVIAGSVNAAAGDVVSVEELAYELKEINLIQDTDFALLAASQMKEKSGDADAFSLVSSTGMADADKKGGFLALSENAGENFADTNFIKARAKLKITFSLQNK